MLRICLPLALLASLPASAQSRGPYIPKEVDIPGFNTSEAAAAKLWNLRAALNVAALQCQWSPYLQTVDRYNAMLKQHVKELNTTRIALEKAFARKGGAKAGPRDFDRFNTRVYQSYATLDAVYGFCRTASDVGRTVLLTPLGKLNTIADSQVTTLRTAMTPVGEGFMNRLTYVALPPITGVCVDRRGRQRSC